MIHALSERRGLRSRRSGAHRLLLVLGTLGLAACGSDGGASSDGLPAAALVSLHDGSTLGAEDIAGPAVVNLWATWCGPCREELPAFQEVHEELDGTVRFVGVNQGDASDAVAEYLAEVGVDFDQYLDEDGALSDGLRITGLPATAFVAADGTLMEVHSGQLTADELRELVATELGVGS